MKLNRLFVVVLLWLSAPASAQQLTSTLTLDSLSFISFEGYENLSIPAGSTLGFRFGSPSADGSVPFVLEPSDVSIGEVPLWSSEGTLRYGLAERATGTARQTPEGIQLSFTASVVATLIRGETASPLTYHLTLTTETARATNATGTTTEEIEGARLVRGPNYVQLAGATTNKTNAFPEPGRAVYLILSGTFDKLPQL